jgi:catechol 2,3-dioxygenase-like lactoylglutathione lyase family enzyme
MADTIRTASPPLSPDRASSPIQSISAITLATHDMGRSVRFYRSLGFMMRYGGEGTDFTSFTVGTGHLNIVAAATEKRWSWWGRVIFYVTDVDAVYRQALRNGLTPSSAPADATWGERYFHINDPDGHELSFARPLEGEDA